VVEKLAGEIISLPMYPQLSECQLEQVAERVLDFVQQRAPIYVRANRASFAAAR